jgi:hypothetical protein
MRELSLGFRNRSRGVLVTNAVLEEGVVLDDELEVARFGRLPNPQSVLTGRLLV